MKCQNCGRENPDAEAFCKHCGRELVQTGTRNCVSCGRPIGWDALVCPYCGRDYRYMALAQTPQGPLVGTGMKILLYLLSFFIPIVGFIIGAIYYSKPEEDYKQVGKICIILGIVSIVVSVGCSALLYVMVLGFGDGGPMTPGINILRKSSIAGGFKIEFTAPTVQVVWSDVSFQLSDGAGFATWQPNSGDLSTIYPPASQYCGSRSGLSGLVVEMNVTDLAGNGMISNGDYITLTATDGMFSSGTVYSLILLYEPTDSSMLAYDFTG